jgi:hypothetical protein
MSSDINARLSRLLHALQLQEIRPMFLQSEAKGPMPIPGSELKLEWKQQFADGDPLAPGPEVFIFRPKYELLVSFQATPIFNQVSTFIVAFQVKDDVIFRELWSDEDLQKVFKENQLQKTLWPIFRQHALDGMSRLGLTPVPLPWLM